MFIHPTFFMTILNKKELKFQARIWVALCMELILTCGIILSNSHKHTPQHLNMLPIHDYCSSSSDAYLYS
jgi:hypothetical protein